MYATRYLVFSVPRIETEANKGTRKTEKGVWVYGQMLITGKECEDEWTK